METTNPGFRNVLSILLLLGCFAWWTEALFNPESFQRKLVAVYKVLDYIRDRPQQMNVDATFGITLTEVNLAAVLLHKNTQYLGNTFLNTLKKIFLLCDLTRRNLMNTVVPENKNDLLLQSVLNKPNLWIKRIFWRQICSEMRCKSSPRLNYLEVINSIWHGTPNEIESDGCLSEIVHSSLNGQCQIPAICIEILTRNDDATGYPLTHRLLIVQTAKAFGCQETKSAAFSDLVTEYCARILQDLANLEVWNFPSIAPDLMSEQIVLCGMEGFSEFTDKRYEDLILNWRHQSGCFSAIGFSNKCKITRRSSSVTDFGCDSHTTALAAASLSLFIRKDVEDMFSQY